MVVRGLLLLALPPCAFAAQIQAEGAVETRVGLSRNWDVNFRTRTRVRAADNDWYDVSAIPVFRYRLHSNLQLGFGTYISRYQYASGWHTQFRPLVNIEPSYRLNRFTFAARTAYERQIIMGGLPDYNRYRERFRISTGKSWAPYGGVELIFLDSGFGTTRFSGGVRKRLRHMDSIEFGYWYETRRFWEQGVRHMFVTTFSFGFQRVAPGG